MVQRSAVLTVGLLGVLATGCVYQVYEGTIQARDSAGRERTAILYWSRTRPLVTGAKAGPAVLRTACGTPITFVEQPEGIVFRGTPSLDRLPGQPGPLPLNAVCGRIRGPSRFLELGEGALEVEMFCEPVQSEFSAVPRAYLQARPEPWVFEIEGRRSFSLMGRVPRAPEPPICGEFPPGP